MRNACRLAVYLACGWLLGLTAHAADAPLGRGVGHRVDNFTLRDVTTDKLVSLYGYRGKRAGVLVFGGTDCPVSNLYMQRLVKLARDYKDRGVVVLVINSNAHETAREVAEHARSYGIDFPVLKDPGNVVADQLQAERTCEALVLDGSARLRYRGAIDNQYGLGKRTDQPSRPYVVEALEAVLAGREVETTATAVVGCPIERVEVKVSRQTPRIRPPPPDVVALIEKAKPPVKVGDVTYAADVAPILQEKCQMCHRPGQVGPFSLLTYDQARRWAASIFEVVDDRRMPPWHADPRYGRFENDRSLSPRERATLLAWVEQGTPLGDAGAVPPPRKFPEEWTIGTPDVVFEIPKTFTVPAEGTVPYQRFRVPTGFTEDRWVQAAEARPGERSVVHHIIVYVDDRKLDNPHGRSERHLVGYAPGDMPSVFRPGVAKRIPAGSDLIFELHYTPTGKERTDRSRVGLIFARKPVTREAVTVGIANTKFAIPPGADNHPVPSSLTVPFDAHLLSFMPHMHLRGKDFRYTAVYPDGKSEVLLSVPAYDFGWQTTYRLAEPKAMPKGTRIDCLAHFDNSAGNPHNPDPTQTVRWGQQTYEEMMIGYIDYVPDRPVDPQKLARRAPARTPPGQDDDFRAGEVLLLNQRVQRELKLSPEQIARVSQAVQEVREGRLKEVQQLGELKGQERLEKVRGLMRAVSTELKKAFAGVLTSEQRARFEQIKLQRRGARAFADPEVQQRLKLSEGQRQKVQAIHEEARKKLGEVLQGRGEVGPQVEVMRHEALEKCVALLTPDQKRSWEQMTGPAFTFDVAEPGRKRN